MGPTGFEPATIWLLKRKQGLRYMSQTLHQTKLRAQEGYFRYLSIIFKFDGMGRGGFEPPIFA